MHRYYQPCHAGRATRKFEGIRRVRGGSGAGGLNGKPANSEGCNTTESVKNSAPSPDWTMRRNGAPVCQRRGAGYRLARFAPGEPIHRVADQLRTVLDAQLLLDALAV